MTPIELTPDAVALPLAGPPPAALHRFVFPWSGVVALLVALGQYVVMQHQVAQNSAAIEELRKASGEAVTKQDLQRLDQRLDGIYQLLLRAAK